MKYLLRMALLAVFSLFACAPKQEIQKRFFWPPLTDEPKIEYVGYFQSDHDVLKISRSFLEEAVFGREVPKPLFDNPFNVYSNGTGKIYVTEPLSQYVLAIDLLNGSFNKLKDVDGLDFVFNSPAGVSGDSVGRTFVVDSKDRKILIFDKSDRLTLEWTGSHFQRPLNIAINEKAGQVYVVEPDKHSVVILDYQNGAYLGTLGTRGTGPGEFNYPLDIDFDSYGNLYVLDALNARVQKFSPEAVFLQSFGERGTALGSFQMPKNLSVSTEGHVYIADSMGHKIIVFDQAGQYLITIGGEYQASSTVAPGGFYLPQSIDVDGNGGIWVVDGLNRIVHQFQYLTEEYLKQNPILPGQAVDPFQK